MRNLAPEQMQPVKITPTGNSDDVLILYLNENNTITPDDLFYIRDQWEKGETEGETFHVPYAAGGIWQVV